MAIRVTQQTMYNNMVGHMQSNLAGYMESVQQGASQKKINRPSDDPAGTYRVLTTRQDMTSTAQYQENVDTAKGWLNLADNVLSNQLTVAITGLKALAEQASTGTYTADQRMIMADQARQYFGQILNLSNTEFEGKSIFGGHKYTECAFQEGLGITTWDKDWDKLVKEGVSGKKIVIEGSTDSTIIVQFLPESETENLAAGKEFRWTKDGGETWNKSHVEPADDGQLQLTCGDGVTLKIPADANINIKKPKEPEKGPAAADGTLLYIRPTAIYMGDDNDDPVDITVMGDQKLAAALQKDPEKIKAEGTFGQNILLRFDGLIDPETGKTKTDPISLEVAGKDFAWSYSTDGGTSWITAKGKTPADSSLRVPIPGGYVDINAASLNAGTQILVHPARADLGYEIMKDTYLPVNSVGKDVFGGYYDDKPALNGDDNLFEVVGAFIGYLEGNNQSGCQKTLVALETAEKRILAEATRIGGMENRLSMAADVLSFQKTDQQERLSYVEDIDLTELLTKLTRQQLSYQTVLQSSSMIMQMSLAKYL